MFKETRVIVHMILAWFEEKLLYGSFLFVSLLEGEQGWVRGGGKILEEALLRGFEEVFGVWGPGGCHKKMC